MQPRPLITHIAEATSGGVARQLDLLAQTLPARGFDIEFIVSDQRDAGFAKNIAAYQTAGLSVHVIPMVRALRPLRDLLALISIQQRLGQCRPVIVHTHASKAGFLGRRAAYALEIPAIIHTPHVFAFEWPQKNLHSSLYQFLERMAARWCDRIVMLSDLQRERVLDLRIAPLEKLCVIPNGIDAKLFPPPTPNQRAAARQRFDCTGKQLVFGMVARLAPQKGIGHFLRAVKQVLMQQPDTLFLIAGDGELRAEFATRVQKSGLENAVRFCGQIDEILPFYHALDGFILASLWEGLPYVILEAQATGLPVIASNTSGAATVIEDGETGLLVPIGDDAMLANAILRVIADSDFRDCIAAWGQARVRELFRLDPWADGLAELYLDILRELASDA